MFISEMYKFHFGGKVFCADGEEGTLAAIGFSAGSRRAVQIGVKPGRFFGKMVYLPFSQITAATGEGLTLSITRAELAAASSSASSLLLDNRSMVRNSPTSARGSLLLVAVHPQSGELAYIVAHHLRPGQDTLLRDEVVTALDANVVTISLPDATLQTLPVYRSDAALQSDVENILFDLTPLHVDMDGMTVRVLDSVLYLDGNISSALRGEIVADQSAGVQGLLEVRNSLIGDDALASDLALALGHDPRTRDLPIGVYPRLGLVRLSGSVHEVSQRAVAEEIARKFPGVRSVINDLVVKLSSDSLNVMASSAGGEASDLIPGRYIRHTK